MKERWKKIRTGLFVVVLIVVGVIEYVQLMQSFDVPQVMLVLPIVGALSIIALRKFWFLVPAGAILLSCIYQIVAGDSNAISVLETDAGNITKVLLYVLPACILFQMLGVGGGALIRLFLNKEKKKALRIVGLVLGILVIFGPYEFFYKNPIYPIQARIQLKNYAEINYQDYKIAEKNVYFDLNTSDYRCRVEMADGVVRMVYFDESGNAVGQ